MMAIILVNKALPQTAVYVSLVKLRSADLFEHAIGCLAIM